MDTSTMRARRPRTRARTPARAPRVRPGAAPQALAQARAEDNPPAGSTPGSTRTTSGTTSGTTPGTTPGTAERPRERLLMRGVDGLTDAELVAVLLGSGVAGRGALVVARDVVGGCGGLAGLVAAAPSKLAAVRGVGPARAARLAAAAEIGRRAAAEAAAGTDALTSPQAVRDYLRQLLAGRPHEVFVALYLDSQNRLVASEELFRGTLAQTSVYPREVVKAALARNAAAMIFAHNHPSGVAEPSRADELLTQALKQALALVDVRTLDHFVVAGGRLTSLAERGLL